MGEVVKLKYPVKDKDREIREVEFKRLKGRDLVESEKLAGEIERSAFLIAKATGLSMETVLEMDAEDFSALSQKVAHFLL